MLDSTVRGLIFLIVLVRGHIEVITSSFSFRTSSALPMPTPSAPHVHMARQASRKHKFPLQKKEFHQHRQVVLEWLGHMSWGQVSQTQ